MRKLRSNFLVYALIFLFGALVSYILTQFRWLTIDYALNVSDVLCNVGGAIIGLYIAHTIQKNINRNQNQYSYLEQKLDSVWCQFNEFSQTVSFSNQIDSGAIQSLSKQVLHPAEFLKTLFGSFQISTTNVEQLAIEIAEFETMLNGLPVASNVVQIDGHRPLVSQHVDKINARFSAIFTELQNL